MWVAPAVSTALSTSAPVVALESTIFSNLGLPTPDNRRALSACLRVIEGAGATPALTAVLDGEACVGVGPEHHETICGPARKVAGRDLAVAMAQRWAFGATTVSASLALAAAAGVRVFATGGIGGVHRDAVRSGDVSADLGALALHPVITVSAGVKVFLDVARTLEDLETRSVPVLGYRCDDVPAFYAVSSGVPVPHRVESAIDVAAIARAHWTVGGGGILVVNPVPPHAAIDGAVLEAAVASALESAERADLTGPAITPRVLAEIAARTGGRSTEANLALAESNAALAAEIAVALSRA